MTAQGCLHHINLGANAPRKNGEVFWEIRGEVDIHGILLLSL